MLQPTETQSTPQKSQYFSNPASYGASTASAPVEQATIGRSLVIKGEISGAESLYIDGRIEGKVSVPEHRVTVGRNGVIAANINAREVVIMGKVQGNVQCVERLDIRSEGSLIGDVITQRISVEEGAVMKGSVEVRAAEPKLEHVYHQAQAKAVAPEASKTAAEAAKTMAATAGNA